MSKQEKRYFRLHSKFYTKEQGNNILRLFEAIERIRPSSGAALAGAVAAEPYAKHLSLLKSQLTEQILDSLLSYSGSRKTSYVLQRQIAHAGLLSERGFYTDAGRLLERAEKKAVQTEDHLQLMEILQRKRLLLFRHVTENLEVDTHNLYGQERDVLAKILSTSTYREMMDRMQIVATRYASHPTPADKKTMEGIASVLRAVEPETLTFHARLAVHSALGTYAFLVNDAAQALEEYRRFVQLWKEYPDMIAELPERYCRCLLNYMSSLISLGTLEEFTDAAQELRGYYTRLGAGLQASFLKDLWMLELLFYFNHGLLDRCTRVVADIEHYCASDGEASIDAASLITLYHNCSVYYFLEGRFARCLDYINALQTEASAELKRDIQSFSRTFSVVAHYELGNLDILDNLIRSTRRYLKKNNEAGIFEKAVMSGMRAIITAVDAREKAGAFLALHHNLLSILHKSDNEPLGITELLFWSQSRIRGCSIRELFTQKMQETSQRDPRALFPFPANAVPVEVV